MVRVFISYSHDTPQHLDRVLRLSDRLRREGIDCRIDLYEESPPEGWPNWCSNQVDEAGFVLVVCTAVYERRFRGKEQPGKGLGASWEGFVITQELYEAQGKNVKFIPIILGAADSAHVPIILRSATFYDLSNEDRYDALYRRLTNQPAVVMPELGHVQSKLQRTTEAPLPSLSRRQDFREPLQTISNKQRSSTFSKKAALIVSIVVVVIAVGYIAWRARPDANPLRVAHTPSLPSNSPAVLPAAPQSEAKTQETAMAKSRETTRPKFFQPPQESKNDGSQEEPTLAEVLAGKPVPPRRNQSKVQPTQPTPPLENPDFIIGAASQSPSEPPVGIEMHALDSSISYSCIERSGMITICGGKWTTYRRMAEDCVNQAAALGRLPERRSTTGRPDIDRKSGGTAK